ncbi:hypothetical protein J6590_081842 [Homalodisca vitripennis]|nr:hypothetical protein J6590_081842 [Homalodisca vitripennis]
MLEDLTSQRLEVLRRVTAQQFMDPGQQDAGGPDLTAAGGAEEGQQDAGGPELTAAGGAGSDRNNSWTQDSRMLEDLTSQRLEVLRRVTAQQFMDPGQQDAGGPDLTAAGGTEEGDGATIHGPRTAGCWRC